MNPSFSAGELSRAKNEEEVKESRTIKMMIWVSLEWKNIKSAAAETREG